MDHRDKPGGDDLKQIAVDESSEFAPRAGWPFEHSSHGFLA
jgi:hypothetical protein